MAEIIAIDLFCGAGGLTRGFLDSGIKVIAGIDWSETAKETYERNNNVPYIKKDIHDIKGHEIRNLLKEDDGKLFLLAGCAPCQPFSTRNSKKKVDDHRIGLLKQFGRLVEESKPDLVFMENVPGIVSMEPGVFENFIAVLEKEGFKFDTKVVDAKNFSVPQTRKRRVLFASRKTIKVPDPANSNDEVKTVRDALFLLPPIAAGEESADIPNHKCFNLAEINMRRIRQTPHDGGSRRDWIEPELTPVCHRNIKGFGNSYGRLKWDEPAPAVTTKFYTYSCGRHGHPEQDRALSYREGALLQSFSMDYVFYGSARYIGEQIGNAVPPKMAYWFGKHFVEHAELHYPSV
jgi:DNA (cytosine-5)-methyltransferase 1